MKDKRDVILEFHSSPDAILNALHQAGWQVIPKAQPQRSEQQEWKKSGDGLSVFSGNELVINMLDKTNDRMQVIRLMEHYHAALAAERQRHPAYDTVLEAQDILTKAYDEVGQPNTLVALATKAADAKQQLLSALAAIKEHNKSNPTHFGCYNIKHDLSLLHKHNIEVRKPLVDAIQFLREGLDQYWHDDNSERVKEIDALAKVKEKPI